MSIESRSRQYGKVFDHWQIKEFLGSGSGGKTAVFRLVRSDSNRGVSALKVVNLIEVRGDINNLSEFRRKEYETARDECSRNAEQEVWLMDDLRGNTNIVDYLDHTFVDWSDETGFGRDLLIRMELLKDLRSELQNGRAFSEREVLKIGSDICIALIRCHRKNILHRDIKPENIFRNKDGDYKLGDFGVSRVLDACPGAVASTGIGTYEYWPAEQMTGRYDKRVDIYSLGLVLYELCNQNRLPFAASTYVTGKEVSLRLAGTPLPKPINGSPALSEVILKACAFDPDERYQSAEELLRALNHVIRSLQKTAERKTSGIPISDVKKKTAYATVPAKVSEVETSGSQYKTIPASADEQKKRTSFSTEQVERKIYATETIEKHVPKYVIQTSVVDNKRKAPIGWIAVALLGLIMVAFSVSFIFVDSLHEQNTPAKNPEMQSEMLLETNDNVASTVHLGNNYYPLDATVVELDGLNERELSEIKQMTDLQSVIICGNGNEEVLLELQEYCHDNMIEFQIRVSERIISDDTVTESIVGITDAEIDLLQFLLNLQTLNLISPQSAPERVFSLREELPQVAVNWEVELYGQTYDSTVTEVDFTEREVTDLAEIERKLAYLPELEQITFGLCGVDEPDWGNSRSDLTASAIENEDLAAYRDRVREDYKVVWTVRLGPNIALRTDKDNFMPNQFGVGFLSDEYAYNLKYCEDMVCLDLGHMTLTDISFVKNMPNLKYLILAWTEVQYIEPIRSCKNLVWLELDNSCIRDYSPLVDCTALEDLNIGHTFCDITPICEMTWLKNLYMIFGNSNDSWKASQALPDTHVVASGDVTVGSGWRRLSNYYDMRDCLGLPYMN